MFGGRLASERPRRRPALLRERSSEKVQKTRRHRADFVLVICAMILLAVGLVVIYSISPGLAASRGVSDNYYVSKQLVAIALGAITFAVAAYVPVAWWRKTLYPLVGLAVISSIAVMLVPLDEFYGAHRWLRIGGLSLQVAEVIKFALLIGIADFLARQRLAGKLTNTNATLKPLLIIVLLVSFIVAKLQSDLGSAGVMIAMAVVMMWMIGLPLKKLALIGTIVIGIAIIAIGSSSYRRERLLTFTHPQADCQTVGYQSCQALIAVGSGGLLGLGLGSSVQAYGYLPEASNDSIFAIMAEKFGFVGVVLIIGLYGLLISRLKRIIERTADPFNQLVVVGVLAWISTQCIINIGAMIGLLPLKGITLPFVSYGGTSLIFLTAALGLVFSISRYTSYSVNKDMSVNETTNNNRSDGRRLGGAYNPNIVSRPRTQK